MTGAAEKPLQGIGASCRLPCRTIRFFQREHTCRRMVFPFYLLLFPDIHSVTRHFWSMGCICSPVTASSQMMMADGSFMIFGIKTRR